MKKLLLILLLTSNICLGQNYRCLQNGIKQYFTNASGYLRGMRIDSVRVSGSDTIYYPYHTPRGYYPTSGSMQLDSTGGSWAGKKVIEQSDGTYLFDNLWHDTVTIKTQANPGDSWVFYNDTTTLYYEASVISNDTMTVLGMPDSVKRILITAHNPSGIVTSDPVDSFTIILSKHNGFVQIFDLYTFPYHAPDSSYRPGLDYYLDYTVNMSASYHPSPANAIFSLVQFVDVTIPEVFQWNAGDIYQYSSCNDFFEHYGTGCYPVEYYYLDTITAVSAAAGGTNYSYHGVTANYVAPWPVSTMTMPSGPFVYSVTATSGTQFHDSTLIVDTTFMPEEFNTGMGSSNLGIYRYQPGDTSYCTTGTLYSRLGFGLRGFIIGSVYNTIFEHYVGPTIYKAPLGLLSSYSSGAGTSGFNVKAQTLLYYNRGGTTCGSLIIPPTAVNDVYITKAAVSLSPVPTHDVLTITSTDKINTVTIYDLLGQVMSTVQYNANKVSVNVYNLPAGMYIIKINNATIRKFVKE